MTTKVLIIALAVAVLLAWIVVRGHGRRLLVLAVIAAIAFPFAWHFIGVHHLFAPPDPYGPCPPPTQYHSGWLPLNGFDQANGSPGEPVPVAGQQAGVVVYHGWVELAGCGMSWTGGVGTG